MKHIKDCELGENWRSCPVCVKSYNETCDTGEELPEPENSEELED